MAFDPRTWVAASRCDRWQEASTCLQGQGFAVIAMTGDASTRCYARLQRADQSLVVACYGDQLDQLRRDAEVNAVLARHRLSPPEVKLCCQHLNCLLQEDIGDLTLHERLSGHADDLDVLWQVCEQLIDWQRGVLPLLGTRNWPRYDHATTWREIEVGVTWFFDRLLKAPLQSHELSDLQDWCHRLADSTPAETLCHRDFHSRNLMLDGQGKWRIIDYQDAILGPIAYDWLSLLKDAYLDWPPHIEEYFLARIHALLRSHELTSLTLDGFMGQYIDWSVQRLLKVLGIFSRLFLRDDNSWYLADMPRVASCLQQTLLRRDHPLAPMIVPKLRAHLCTQ